MDDVTEQCGWHSWPNPKKDPICRRPYTREDGWGFRACDGHFRIGQLNKNGGDGIPDDIYLQKYKDAIQWLNENPNPPEVNG